MKKIVLCSWGQLEGNHSNFGDKLILETQVELLRDHYKDLEIFCMSGMPEYTKKTYAIEAANPFTFRGFFSFINYIRLCDLVIVGGGELIQDKSSKMYLLFNLFPLWAAKLFRKKCVALGIGISSINELSFLGRIFARSLALLDACGVRDEMSFENAKNFHIKRDKLFLSSDIVFSSKRHRTLENSIPNVPIKPANGYIVVSLRDITGRKGGLLPASIQRRFSPQRIENNKQLCDFLNTFAETLNSVMTRLDIGVVLWPTYSGKNFSSRDDAVHQYIYDRISKKEDICKIDTPMTFEQILALLANASLLVGMPLHSMIMATIAHCPFIGIIYAEKNRNFLRQLNYPEHWVYSLTEEKGNEIKGTSLYNTMLDVFENRNQVRAELKKHQERLSGTGRMNLEILNRFLKND